MLEGRKLEYNDMSGTIELGRQPIKDAAPGQGPDTTLRIEPGHPERSGLAERMASRWAAQQMPPLGTELADGEALDLVRRWIIELEGSSSEMQQGGTRG